MPNTILTATPAAAPYNNGKKTKPLEYIIKIRTPSPKMPLDGLGEKGR